MRKFDTGATRDDDKTFDPEGFYHPLVVKAFCRYMEKNRVQKDGSIRDSDNWTKGIPCSAYMKSLWRHVLDAWLHHRGAHEEARDSLEEALCAIIFNAQGYLYELEKYKLRARRYLPDAEDPQGSEDPSTWLKDQNNAPPK